MIFGEYSDIVENDSPDFCTLGVGRYDYVFRINSKYLASEIDNSDGSQDTPSKVYTLLLVLLLFFSLVLLVSSVTFTVFGFKVFRKVLRFNKEVILIIPMRHLEESLEEEHAV